MNGAESLIRTLAASGVRVCFANPGTTEIHLVAALDQFAELRCILGLAEGVVAGAADGYARMTGKPATTLLHLGPGLANGLANLHNANRARVPLVNVVGEHATRHRRYDPPLAADIEAIARPYTGWLRTTAAVADLGRDAAEAVAAARAAPGRIATLIVPADIAWSEGGEFVPPQSIPSPPVPSAETIEHAAAMLRSGVPTALVLAGNALWGEGLRLAGRVAAATDATLLAPYSFTRMSRGAGVPVVQRIPFPFEQAVDHLKAFRQLILVGTTSPVAFFGYPGKPSVTTPPDCSIFALARPGEDYVGALAGLLASLPPGESEGALETPQRPSRPTGVITLPGLASAIGSTLPEDAIVVDESMTSGRGIITACRGVAPHDWMVNTGGAIGIALPLAVGAAVACPGRRVLCISADGSGMYNPQALWTMAREGLAVTTVVLANRAYAILKGELANLKLGEPGRRAHDMLEIGRPDPDWVSLAKGFGVPGVKVTSLDAFAGALDAGFASEGPNLIEVAL